MPITEDLIDVFIAIVMPKMKKLHTLMLHTGHVADLRPAPVAESGPDGGWLLMGDAEVRDQELERLKLAKSLFRRNREIMQKEKEKGDVVSALRCIGISTHVYCCMLPITGVSADPESIFTIQYVTLSWIEIV